MSVVDQSQAPLPQRLQQGRDVECAFVYLSAFIQCRGCGVCVCVSVSIYSNVGDVECAFVVVVVDLINIGFTEVVPIGVCVCVSVSIYSNVGDVKCAFVCLSAFIAM